jgi:hypothetical protein
MAKASQNKRAKTSRETEQKQTEINQDIITLLQGCHNECRRMFMECAPKESGHNLSFLHLKRLQACIEICGSTAEYLLKDGVMAYRLCEITARICEQCADSCDKMEDAYFQECAELCRETAEACLEEGLRLRQMETRRRKSADNIEDEMELNLIKDTGEKESRAKEAGNERDTRRS